MKEEGTSEGTKKMDIEDPYPSPVSHHVLIVYTYVVYDSSRLYMSST